MGQAAVELPDATAKPSAAAGASADDLLSQLAGDEIDRLMAEADKDLATSPPAEALAVTDDPPAAPVAPPNAEAAVQAQLDALFHELSTGAAPAEPAIAARVESAPAESLPGPTAAAAVTAPAPAAADVAATADVSATATPATDASAMTPEPPVVAGAPPKSVAAAPTAAVESPAADAGPTAELTTAAPPAPAESAPAQDAASLDAQLVRTLGDVAPSPSVAPAAAPAPAAVPAPPPTPHDPWYVRLLELVNAPFAAVSAEMRELLGKIAIVTAFNALFVMIYVLFFRA